MNKTAQNFYFSNLLEIIRKLPNLILEALFIEIVTLLRENYNIEQLLRQDRTDMFQLYTPELTEYGLMILQRAEKKKLPEGIDKNLVKYVSAAKEKKNIIDICISNHWTLEQCAILTHKCMERNFIKHSITPSLYNVIQFISGSLKIGEFLMRKNKIDSNTLEYALNLQNQLSSSFGEKSKIVEILVNMGKVKQEDVLDFLNLKESSKRYIQIQAPITPETHKLRSLVEEYKQNLENITANYNNLSQEKNKMQRKCEELNEQLQMQIERNNMLQKKLQDSESKLGFFKKL
ncbi:MAG: hypothetical protein AB1782_06630 [Cyanobacteriota bacterium]